MQKTHFTNKSYYYRSRRDLEYFSLIFNKIDVQGDEYRTRIQYYKNRFHFAQFSFQVPEKVI